MRCKQYRLEISLGLDGRLPTGRRNALTAHLEQCAECRRELGGAKAAQELVLGLPSERVGHDFRTTLWERIESGEGSPATPPIVGVSLATKARWVLTGAAAAAVVIVLANATLRRTPPVQPGEVAPVARAEDRPEGRFDGRFDGRGERNLMVADGTPPSFRGEPVPFGAAAIAKTTAQSVATSASKVKMALRSLDRREARYLTPQQFRAEVERPVNDLRTSARLMRRMHDKQIIDLPQSWIEQLPRIEDSIAMLAHAGSLAEIGLALRPLDSVKPEQLNGNFRVWCCDRDRELLELISDLSRQDEQVHQFFSVRIMVSDESLEPGKVPQVWMMRVQETAPKSR